MASGPTPAQTIGPFFHVAIPSVGEEQIVPEGTEGAVRIEGRVFDGDGQPVDDALVEVWQASPDGRFDDPGFSGFGRCATDAEGRYHFVTLRPGPVPGPGGSPQAPHLDLSVFARGLLHRLVTRIYFPHDAEAHGRDPVLQSIGDPEARSTLVAGQAGPAGQAEGVVTFDIHLQGERETVFFAV